MLSKFKNIIIFVIIGILMVMAYIFFTSGSEEEVGLVSTSAMTPSQAIPNASAIGDDSEIAKDFLALLLSVKNITLNDQIFSDVSFQSLKDSSIEIIHDNSEGRPNPFAPIGTDSSSTVINAFTPSRDTSRTTPISNPSSLPPSGTGTQTEEDFDIFSNVDLSEPDLSFDGTGDIGN